MTRYYAIVDKKGKMVGERTLNAYPTELSCGMRLSVQGYDYDDNAWPHEVHYHKKDSYEAIVVTSFDQSKKQYYHHYEIVGNDLDEIQNVIEKLSHLFGAVDRSFDFSLRYSMPDIKGFWKRVKFLFWDFLIHGDTEPK